MELKNLVNVIFVRDIEISKNFYSNVLKQEISLDFGTNVIYKSGFAIWQLRDNHVISRNLGEPKINDTTVNRFELCFETNDIESVYSDLLRHNISIFHTITEEIWGQKTVRFFDPDNHLIEVGETLEKFVLRFYNKGMSILDVSERTFVPIPEIERIINTQLSISQAVFSDLPIILELQKDCFVQEAKLVDDYNIPPLTQNLSSITLDFDRITFLKGEINGNIIGSVRAYEDNSTCYIGRLLVKQGFQNQGIGRKLMQAIEDTFSDCERYELFTSDKSLKNIYMYNSIGYTEFKRSEISENVTIVYFEKRKK